MDYFFLNQGISFTLRGTRSVAPFLPSSDFDDLTVFLPEVVEAVFSTTFFATSLVLDAAFFAFDFAFDATVVAAFFDLEAVDFAADLAFLEVFFATPAALSAALAAAETFFATAALNPASCNFFEPAEATLETESIFAEINFLAVAAPIPGSAVNASIFEFPFFDIGSLLRP